jgi:hypothetical protein
MARLWVDEINPGTASQVTLNNANIQNSTVQNTTFAQTNTFSGTSNFTGSVSLPNTFGFKNKLINGDMRIDQRNLGASVTPSDTVYVIDRWFYRMTQTSKFTVQQNAGSLTTPTMFPFYLGATSSSAYTSLSTDFFGLIQRIEGINVHDLMAGTSSAVNITLSFWVYSSLTGIHSGSIKNGNETRSYVFTFTINSVNTWEFKTITFPLDQSGTWSRVVRVSGLVLTFNYGSGSNFLASPNTWLNGNFYGATTGVSLVGTNAATLHFTGVQLEGGSVATTFDYRDYGIELLRCKRYCHALQAGGFTNRIQGTGLITSSTNAIALINLPTTMMGGSFSTIASTSQISFWDGSTVFAGGAAGTNTAFTNSDEIQSIAVAVTSATANRHCFWWLNSTTARIVISSELIVN